MSPPNGHANGTTGGTNGVVPAPVLLGMSQPQFTADQIKDFVSQLETPFDPAVIEWRVMNTSKDKKRGQVIPYADQRAYTDRLNAIFTPAGWTRRYTVHTSANFQREKDQQTVAKVFVTCDLSIFCIGSHSATGEEWTDDDNAGTSAEAQAFKRACSCFGLGRYLYYFTGTWVELDNRKWPKERVGLAGWATPEGWKQGLRPTPGDEQQQRQAPSDGKSAFRKQTGHDAATQGERTHLVQQIEALAEPLGRGLYRGLLKSVARAWNPDQIQDIAILQRVLVNMQSAERGLLRLSAALEKTGAETFGRILYSVNIRSLNEVTSLETLQKIVQAMEAKAADT
jgi:hypothetical protein